MGMSPPSWIEIAAIGRMAGSVGDGITDHRIDPLQFLATASVVNISNIVALSN